MTDWDQYAKRLHVDNSEIPTWLVELLSATDCQTAADFGCGDGVLLHNIIQLQINPKIQLYGLDRSQTRLDRLANRLPNVIRKLTDVSGPIDLPDQILDLAISTQVIEHVQDQKAMLREMARLLKPEGKLFLTTVFKHWYGWYFYRCEGRWTIDPTHLREYRRDEELLPDLEKSGFRLLKQRKVQLAYALVDPLLKIIGAPQLNLGPLRKIKVQIPGYFTWEIVAQRL